VGNGDIKINKAKKSLGLYIRLIVVIYKKGSAFWKVFVIKILIYKSVDLRFLSQYNLGKGIQVKNKYIKV
jgi:hypothetical protein